MIRDGVKINSWHFKAHSTYKRHFWLYINNEKYLVTKFNDLLGANTSNRRTLCVSTGICPKGFQGSFKYRDNYYAIMDNTIVKLKYVTIEGGYYTFHLSLKYAIYYILEKFFYSSVLSKKQLCGIKSFEERLESYNRRCYLDFPRFDEILDSDYISYYDKKLTFNSTLDEFNDFLRTVYNRISCKSIEEFIKGGVLW